MMTPRQLTNTRFGAIDYSDADVTSFPEGIIGFPNLTSFVLVAPRPESSFRWLQSLDEASVAFLLVDPDVYVSEYEPEISTLDAEMLALTEATPQLVFTTACIPEGNVAEMTLNLAAPIVLNLEARIGKQVVLEGDAYNIRHRVFPQANPTSDMKAA